MVLVSNGVLLIYDIVLGIFFVSLKFIDLFAGIGGLSIPFRELGFECVFSSEIDKHAQKTYKDNFGHIPYGDITTIKEDEIPQFDLLLGGFPCQPFSQAGKQLGFNDTRGTLFFEIARILKHHKPQVFLLENVKRLKTHNSGKTFATILKVLQDLGYNIYSKILNAKDFGLPQNRERIYIVGFLDKVEFNFPTPSKIETKLSDILEKQVEDKYTISNHLWQYLQNRKQKEKGNGFGYSLFTKDSNYVSTISARYYKDGSEILIYQENKNPRKLTPKEASRLQGFPENFTINPSNMQAYKQFGNSVPVSVVREIAKNISLSLKYKNIINNKVVINYTEHNNQLSFKL